MSDIIKDTKSRMQKSIDNLSRELANISAGRANSNLLNGVTVDYYGAPTPVQQLASINVPEARLLVIRHMISHQLLILKSNYRG